MLSISGSSNQVLPGTTALALSHCRVLPPGKFNDIIPQPLAVRAESLIAVFT